MQCLYCNRHLGFFNTGKGPFCSEKHEELYGKAAMGRLDAPYEQASGTLADATASEDLSKLLQATQQDRGVTVEAPAHMPVATASADAVPVSVGTTHAEGMATSDSLTAAPTLSGGGAPPPRDSSAHSPIPEFSGGLDNGSIEEDPERRGEPRVKAIAIVKVAPLKDADRELTCALVNKSGTGIQFTSAIDFKIRDTVIVELPEQLVLAEVKHSEAVGGKFVIGAELVQSAQKDTMPPGSSGMERADVLIKALCDRVRTGFSEPASPETEEAATHNRAHALERVARILEIWQNTRLCPLPEPAPESESTEKVEAVEPKHSSGGGRTFAAVAAALVLTGLLTVYIVQFRKGSQVAVSKPAPASQPQSIKSPEAASAPAVTPPITPAPTVSKPVATETASAPPVAKPTQPVEQPIAAVAPGQHRVQIKAIESTWVGVSADGHKLFGVMIPKGTTKELEYSKYAFVHTGNAAGVEILLDGQPVPMGTKPALRLVELTSSGFKFLRWSNDDPPQP